MREGGVIAVIENQLPTDTVHEHDTLFQAASWGFHAATSKEGCLAAVILCVRRGLSRVCCDGCWQGAHLKAAVLFGFKKRAGLGRLIMSYCAGASKR